ncbi:hypothetical protein WJX73_009649 [Symbiochloris irregularis]|uniref:Uncharacterized protein n=1 Tax=Symbiochloris irregularis TaxID=706552 RepID=A0AAW1P3J7_9CHLO
MSADDLKKVAVGRRRTANGFEELQSLSFSGKLSSASLTARLQTKDLWGTLHHGDSEAEIDRSGAQLSPGYYEYRLFGGTEVIVFDLDGAPTPQTFYSQEHLRGWAEMNGVRGLRLDAGPNLACHFSQLQTGKMYRMTGGAAGVGTRLDDLDRNVLNSAHASEDEMVLALRDRLLQEGYSMSGIDSRPELRILRDRNGRAVKEFDGWVYAFHNGKKELWLGSRKAATDGTADVKELVTDGLKYVKLSEDGCSSARRYSFTMAGRVPRFFFLADHVKEPWRTEPILDKYCREQGVRRFARTGKNLRQVVPKTSSMMASRCTMQTMPAKMLL